MERQRALQQLLKQEIRCGRRCQRLSLSPAIAVFILHATPSRARAGICAQNRCLVTTGARYLCQGLAWGGHLAPSGP